jgi:hypothetical protein
LEDSLKKSRFLEGSFFELAILKESPEGFIPAQALILLDEFMPFLQGFFFPIRKIGTLQIL